MSNPIRVGLVGLGRAGVYMHLTELQGREDKFKIVAVCDEIESRAVEYGEKLGAKAYTRIEDLVADPDVELVDIATRSIDHYAHTKLALLAGKDVQLEKPFCTHAWEAEELIALGSQPAGPHLYIRHNRRFEDHYEQANKIIDSGILGEVYEIKLARNNYDRRRDWQTLSEFGGGQLLNWGPHIVDHSLRFCGDCYEVLYSNLKHIAAGGDCEDHIKIVFTGVNGRIVDMEISGGCATPVPEYTMYGSKGALYSAEDGFHVRYLNPEKILAPVVSDPATPGSSQSFGSGETLDWIERVIPYEEYGDCPRIWDALYSAIRENIPHPVKLHEALDVIRVIEEVKEGTIFEN
ncbi:MAG: Gfo/Idh/MocA family oxidoreductase [Clostridia bacterium]|nr:Gfo/Idh/MocA family oxidoreductase [Clostridia bacterium]